MVQVDSAEQGKENTSPQTLTIKIRPFDFSMNRAAFVCSDKKLTDYFVGTGFPPRTLEYDIRQGAAAAHVMLNQDTSEILGYFTLSNLSIPVKQLPTNKLRKNQLQEVSVTLLGRMAVHESLAGQGYGGKLLVAALLTAQKGVQYSGSTAVVVDPKTENLVPFYAKYRFIALQDPPYPLRMFLPMGTVDELANNIK